MPSARQGFRGVVWDKKRRLFRARVQYRHKVYRLGHFESAHAAACAVARQRVKLGVACYANDPDDALSRQYVAPTRFRRGRGMGSVHFCKEKRLFRATRKRNGKIAHIGYFPSKRAAEEALARIAEERAGP
jgi:hypothetical protein